MQASYPQYGAARASTRGRHASPEPFGAAAVGSHFLLRDRGDVYRRIAPIASLDQAALAASTPDARSHTSESKYWHIAASTAALARPTRRSRAELVEARLVSAAHSLAGRGARVQLP